MPMFHYNNEEEGGGVQLIMVNEGIRGGGKEVWYQPPWVPPV